MRRALPVLSALKREQRAQLKKQLAQRLIRTMAATPTSRTHIKKLAMEAEVLTEKGNTVPQPEARPCATPQEESSQGPLLLSWPLEPSSLPSTPAILEQQLVASLSGEPQGHPALPSMCPSLILNNCATPDPLLLQPQVPSTSDEALLSATLEWERKLEAAGALLALKNSPWAPPDALPLHQPCSPGRPTGMLRGSSRRRSGPCLLGACSLHVETACLPKLYFAALAGDRGLQLPSPSAGPRRANYTSVAIGRMGCIFLLT
ncbi:doublesex- and mab-3-related transcription factor C1-like [Heterocephalus glaber]|uniref:Doublesex- and mab-3-related transcription factor C1-like n=1 Tax=Heterocephalus glaber TaxID=10181 RepID=A0A0P6J975_HETGA|nr:doublesex- and mab-3-related transcription factor C1-like [Heterocephalus glaber]